MDNNCLHGNRVTCINIEISAMIGFVGLVQGIMNVCLVNIAVIFPVKQISLIGEQRLQRDIWQLGCFDS